MFGNTLKLAFNPLYSKTFWAALGAGALYILERIESGHALTWVDAATAGIIVLAALGVRDAIAKNGVGSTPESADEANKG